MINYELSDLEKIIVQELKKTPEITAQHLLQMTKSAKISTFFTSKNVEQITNNIFGRQPLMEDFLDLFTRISTIFYFKGYLKGNDLFNKLAYGYDVTHRPWQGFEKKTELLIAPFSTGDIFEIFLKSGYLYIIYIMVLSKSNIGEQYGS